MKTSVSQDWKLPIPGFLVVSPKRHVEKFNELSENERIEIFNIVNKTIEIMKKIIFVIDLMLYLRKKKKDIFTYG